ncbi:hypothetical protein D3C87_1124100 [compost metagenome]
MVEDDALFHLMREVGVQDFLRERVLTELPQELDQVRRLARPANGLVILPVPVEDALLGVLGEHPEGQELFAAFGADKQGVAHDVPRLLHVLAREDARAEQDEGLEARGRRHRIRATVLRDEVVQEARTGVPEDLLVVADRQLAQADQILVQAIVMLAQSKQLAHLEHADPAGVDLGQVGHGVLVEIPGGVAVEVLADGLFLPGAVDALGKVPDGEALDLDPALAVHPGMAGHTHQQAVRG